MSRDPKRAANFDQFASRNDGFPTPREGVERQQDGGGIVVDGERGRGFGEQGELRADSRQSVTPPTGFEIEFEVRVARGSTRDGPNGIGLPTAPALDWYVGESL